MKKRLLAWMLALAMALSLASAAFAAEEPVIVSLFGTENYDMAAEVVERTNSLRIQEGAPELSRSKTLTELAMQRAAEISLYFSHTRCCGKESDSILNGAYSGWSRFGENIAIGQGTPEQVMENWMDSQGHRENILTSGYTQLGVGCFTTGGVTCWVQLFSDSTTNTAVTDRTDRTEVWWELEILPSYLDLRLDGSENVELDPGETVNMAIRTVNPEFSYCQPILMPSKAVSSNQNAVSVKMEENGSFTITADKPGNATVELRVFDGQSPAQIIHVTVTGKVEEPDPTTSTEPTTSPDPTTPSETTPPSNPFTDVKETDYFYESILWAVGKGITTGITKTQFGPGNPCTRAQVVTFLWRAAGSPEPASGKNPFSDVGESNYYYKAVLWAVENGITTGMSATKFGPNNTCTRAQVATFLWRTAGSPEPASGKNPFSDVGKSNYYYKAVLWAVEGGVTKGISATRFGPNNTCTRGQIVTFLYRAFQKA